jgi:hypothetical protein
VNPERKESVYVDEIYGKDMLTNLLRIDGPFGTSAGIESELSLKIMCLIINMSCFVRGG